jgi:hypothetical protein
MNQILPIITMTELQRNPKDALARLKDYAVIRSHGQERAFVLHPLLGKVLLESGMLQMLREKAGMSATEGGDDAKMEQELKGLIGNVLRELSKK